MRVLRAGPVTVLLDGVDLRYLRIGGTELVRRVYVAVRDVDWDTVPGTFRVSRWSRGRRASASSSTSATHGGRSTSAGTARSPGDESGRVEVVLDGRAADVLPYNRIGICVHHPWRETKAARFRARTPDGEVEGRFPDLIGPQGFEDGMLPRPVSRVRSARGRARDRRPAAARVRGRPVGDGGSPQLDRRQLQDVLDTDRPRPAGAPRSGPGDCASAS